MGNWIKVLQRLMLLALLAGLALTVLAPVGLAGDQAGSAQWVTSAAQGPALGQIGGGEQDDAVNWIGDFFGGGGENAVNWNTDPRSRWYIR